MHLGVPPGTPPEPEPPYAPVHQIPRPTFLRLFALLLVSAAAVFAYVAASPRPLETHEVFVAQTTREMLASGDLVFPTFGGEPRLKKPPLMYWAVAAVAGVTGRHDVPPWIARLPSVLSALALLAITGAIAATVFDRRTALLSAGMLAFSVGVFSYTGNARPEMLYAACTCLALLGFVLAWERRPLPSPDASAASSARGSLPWVITAWVGVGLAILAKGPQLPALLFLGLSFAVVRAEGWRAWRRAFRPALGLVIALAVTLPWVVAVVARTDAAASTWTNELIGLRFSAEAEAGAGGPGAAVLGYLLEVLTPEYLLSCVEMLLPWGLLLPIAAFVVWQRGRPDLARGRMLFFALLFALVGLSLATHTRDYYLLPALPVLGILLARAMLDLFDKLAARPRARRAAVALAYFAAAAALGATLAIETLSGWRAIDVAIFAAAFPAALGVARLAAAHLRAGPLARPAVASVALWAAAFGTLADDSLLWGERRMNVDRLARHVAGEAGPDLPVVAVGFDKNDLIYHLNRPPASLPDDASPADIAGHAPAIVVAPVEALDALEAAGTPIRRGRRFAIGSRTIEAARLLP